MVDIPLFPILVPSLLTRLFKNYTDARLGPSIRNTFTGSLCPYLEGDKPAQRVGCIFPELPQEPVLGMMGREHSEEEKWTALGTGVGEAGTVFIGRRATWVFREEPLAMSGSVLEIGGFKTE